MNKTAIVSVDLGATNMRVAFFDLDKKLVHKCPPKEVARIEGHTDAEGTLRLIADSIKEGVQGWTVAKLAGMCTPGEYRDDGGIDPATVPNIPGLAGKKPADMLEGLLGDGWKVYANNDGMTQTVAAGDIFVNSPDYDDKWANIVEKSGGKAIYFGPGTGFGAGKVSISKDRQVKPLPGSVSFFDMVIRDGKTAEELISGSGISRMVMEKKELFLRYGDPITGKTVSDAYYSGDEDAKEAAEKIFAQTGRDLAGLMIQLHEGRGEKAMMPWDERDWEQAKGTRVFLVSGFLTKPIGKDVILPHAREVLKDVGYSEKIHIIEIDRPEQGIGLLGSSLLIPWEEKERYR